MSTKNLAISDCLPDLIVGLTGIPTGLAVQNLAEKIIEHYNDSNVSQLLQGISVFLLIVSFYIFYSIALFLSIELLKRNSAEDDKLWQKIFVDKSPQYISSTLVMIAAVTLLGHLYDPVEWNDVNRALVLIVAFGILMSPLLFLGMDSFDPKSQLISEEFPNLLPKFRAAIALIMFLIILAAIFL